MQQYAYFYHQPTRRVMKFSGRAVRQVMNSKAYQRISLREYKIHRRLELLAQEMNGIR